ncbi:MAG: hypothetical protein ACLFPN_04685 [Methanomassiliicoccales archaeon]
MAIPMEKREGEWWSMTVLGGVLLVMGIVLFALTGLAGLGMAALGVILLLMGSLSRRRG